MSGKTLVMVGGPMGVGKTTTCRLLLERLTPGAYLDGDWCWTVNPFVVTPENQVMVLGNIGHLLRGYLTNHGLRYVILGWVLHRREIMDAILHSLRDLTFDVHLISLTCTPERLRERLTEDVAQGRRLPDVIERSLARLPLYERLPTIKVDVGDISAQDAADVIVRQVLVRP